jgi:pyridoxamine 5'-phosphate oxidase family protein
MSVFTDSELAYLRGDGVRRFARLATVGTDGTPHVDDLASTDPWRPRGIEVRGRAEAIDGARPMIRIHSERVVPWGLGPGEGARTVGH